MSATTEGTFKAEFFRNNNWELYGIVSTVDAARRFTDNEFPHIPTRISEKGEDGEWRTLEPAS